jgi:nitroimidazol reductase NimA-like FMN-containing flavoprotein (pyridoxamine 5'-phosphate oxidase superfamily)
MERLLADAGHGFLGCTGADGWPLVFPLNFVYAEGMIYFHGAPEGEKMEAIVRDPRVSFTAAVAASLIPSYFRDPRSACPATQYYRSVMVRGRARVVEDAEEKARALQALMEKLQPEGGYEPIDAADRLYRGVLATTAVVAIHVEGMSGRFRFGQGRGARQVERIRQGLRERDTPLDRSTLEWMEILHEDR